MSTLNEILRTLNGYDNLKLLKIRALRCCLLPQGSAVAFTWSLYRDLDDLQKHPLGWKCQKQEHASVLGENETCVDEGIQKNKIYFEDFESNEEESFTDHFKKSSKTCVGRPLYVRNVQSQCRNCGEQHPKTLDVNAQTYPLMHLWNIGSYTAKLKKTVKCESWVKGKDPELSVRKYVLDIEKVEDEIVADSDAKLSLHIRTKSEIGKAENDTVESSSAELLTHNSESKNNTERTSEDGTLSLDDGASSQICNRSDSGCGSASSRMCIQPEAATTQDNGKEDHVEELLSQKEKQTAESNHNPSQYELYKEESSTSSVATTSSVLVEDCSESGDEYGSTDTSNQASDQGINHFSDSLLEVWYCSCIQYKINVSYGNMRWISKRN